MKISARQYAQSLYEALAGKSEAEVKAALRNFVILLARRRDLNKGGEIARRLSEIWDDAEGTLSADLVGARLLSETVKTVVINYLKNRAGAKKIVIKEEVDKKIIGGFILKYGSQILDGSLKTNLAGLKEKISG